MGKLFLIETENGKAYVDGEKFMNQFSGQIDGMIHVDKVYVDIADYQAIEDKLDIAIKALSKINVAIIDDSRIHHGAVMSTETMTAVNNVFKIASEPLRQIMGFKR